MHQASLSIPALCHGNLRESSGLTLTDLQDQQSPRRQKFLRVHEKPTVELQTITPACQGEPRLKHSDLWLKIEEVTIWNVGRIRNDYRHLAFQPMSPKGLKQITTNTPSGLSGHPQIVPTLTFLLERYKAAAEIVEKQRPVSSGT